MVSRALLLCLAVVVLAVPASASAAPFELGVQDDGAFYDRYAPRGYGADLAFSQAQQLHAKSVRTNVLWSRVVVGADQTTRPAVVSYDWSALDAFVERARAHGLRVQMVLSGPAPAWATADRKVGVNQPNAAEYGEFVRAAMTHFKGRVTRYAVWNEPNWPSLLAPQRACPPNKRNCVSAPRIYRKLYDAAWQVARTVDPAAELWIGELAPQGRPTSKGASTAPLAFMREVLCPAKRCKGLQTHGFALHPYNFAKPTTRPRGADDVTIAVLPRITTQLKTWQRKRLMRTPKGGRAPLYLSEYGYLMQGSRRVTERQQAQYTAQSIALAKKAGARQLIMYQMIDPPKGSEAWNSGLLRDTGVQRPVFDKLRRVMSTNR